MRKTRGTLSSRAVQKIEGTDPVQVLVCINTDVGMQTIHYPWLRLLVDLQTGTPVELEVEFQGEFLQGANMRISA